MAGRSRTGPGTCVIVCCERDVHEEERLREALAPVTERVVDVPAIAPAIGPGSRRGKDGGPIYLRRTGRLAAGAGTSCSGGTWGIRLPLTLRRYNHGHPRGMVVDALLRREWTLVRPFLHMRPFSLRR